MILMTASNEHPEKNKTSGNLHGVINCLPVDCPSGVPVASRSMWQSRQPGALGSCDIEIKAYKSNVFIRFSIDIKKSLTCVLWEKCDRFERAPRTKKKEGKKSVGRLTVASSFSDCDNNTGRVICCAGSQNAMHCATCMMSCNSEAPLSSLS